MPTQTLHHIEPELEPAPTDWPLFMRWLTIWSQSSRPAGPCKSGQALPDPDPPRRDA